MSQFKAELLRIKGYFSTWIAALGAMLVMAYQQMPPDMLAGLNGFLAAYPSFRLIAPLAWFVCWVLARAAPQGGPVDEEQAH